MKVGAFFFGALVLGAAAGVACTSGGTAAGDCGENACGACQGGFVSVDRCEDGKWICECVPRESDAGRD